MKELHNKIDLILKDSNIDKLEIESIKNSETLFPFSTESRILAYLLAINAISYEQYDEMNQEYNERNKYLQLFDLAPRTFGQTWGEQHLLSLFPQFTKATKENLSAYYPSFDGEL